MKKITLLFVLAFCSLLSNAQITYSSSEYAVAKDSFLITTGTAFNMSSANFDSTGTNIHWDYSTLPMTTQKVTQYNDNNYPAYKSTFVASCISACVNAGGTTFTCTNACNTAWNKNNLSRPSLDSIELNGVQLSDGVDILYKSTAALTQNILAYTMDVSGVSIPLTITYNGTDSIYHFPLAYNDKDSSEYNYAIDLNEYGIPLTYASNKKRINHIEGWGQLTTPYKNYPNVLKLKTIIERQDTVTLDTIKIGQGVLKTIKYSWFASGYKIPVLEAMGQIVNGVEQITTVMFLDTARCLTPEALFSYSPVTIFINGGVAAVNFMNQSINADNFSWNFDDAGSGANNTSTIQHPSHDYSAAGTYAVQLIACSPALCSTVECDTTIIPVVIIDSTAVYAEFKYLPAHPCMGDSVHFVNTSINATTYDWDFGDGSTSVLKNPTHYYLAAGTYTVTLESKKAAQSDIITKEITIAGGSVIDAIANTTINYGDSIELTVNGGNNATYVWSPANSLSCATCQSPYGFPKTTTTYTVTAYDLCGIAGTDTVQVVVNGPTGIRNVLDKKKSIIVYPNPAKSTITIVNTENTEWIRVVNVVGETVLSKNINANQMVLNIEQLPQGLYYIQAKSLQGVQVQPLIIQH